MSSLSGYRLPLFLQFLVFFIPVNVFVIGDWLGTGVQWTLFRYQQSYMGNSLILVSRDIFYVMTGLISGRSAISSFFWIAGSVLFIIALILILSANIHEDPAQIRYGAFSQLPGVYCSSWQSYYSTELRFPAPRDSQFR